MGCFESEKRRREENHVRELRNLPLLLKRVLVALGSWGINTKSDTTEPTLNVIFMKKKKTIGIKSNPNTDVEDNNASDAGKVKKKEKSQ